jgi:MFS family permease
VVTMMATTPANAYQMLTIGMFIFAFANGTLEAVANPLVATLFPNNRTHYLNILHASWPLGMILGVVAGWYLDDRLEVHWKTQLALYLIPTALYGLMFLGQKMPKSEASEKGSSLGEMFKDVGVLGGLVVCYLLTLFISGNLGIPSGDAFLIGGALLLVVGVISRQLQKPAVESYAGLGICVLIAIYAQAAFQLSATGGLAIAVALACGLGTVMKWSMGSFLLFSLFIVHALVGAVELGTDGWIQNITGNLFTSEQGKALFLWTSAIMFGLRFCADFIEKKLGMSPVALLFTCAVLAVVGLNLSSGMKTFPMALIALGIYAVGKTFFWPTMLAVASDRFPRTGAVAISIMGGIGMLSAGLIGGPGLGYAKDRFSAEALKTADQGTYEQVKAANPSKFLIFGAVNAIDGKKLGEVQGTLGSARKLLPKDGLKTETEKLDEKIAKARKKAAAAQDSLKKIDDEIASLLGKNLREWDDGYTEMDERVTSLRENRIKVSASVTKAQGEVSGLEGQKTTLVSLNGKLEAAGVLKPEGNPNLNAALAALTPQERAVQAASIKGDRKTLKADSAIPMAMAVIYLLMMVYFKSIGGYKPVHLEGTSAAKAH